MTSFIDLGMSPLCESYLAADHLNDMEPFYPLHAYMCANCHLVQLDEFVTAQSIFEEYAYFSSYSDTWLDHARTYVDDMMTGLPLTQGSHVVEIASNDGYLLQYFLGRGVDVLGVEPARNVAAAAIDIGIPTLIEFFDVDMAQRILTEHRPADLIVANNVLAQVPDLNSFVAGVHLLLANDGIATFEFPHLLKLIEENQFDTIYHEHFSYFSLMTAVQIFAGHGLRVIDVQELPTHGGSLRVFVARDTSSRIKSKRVEELIQQEASAGLLDPSICRAFQQRVEKVKHDLLDFLIQAKRQGKRTVGYGAPGKGNTLLNYCGIRTDLVEFTVDRNPYKQGMYLPGTHIPIYSPEMIDEVEPDYVLILPWNFKDEIVHQLSRIREWGGSFVVPIPSLQVLAGNSPTEWKPGIQPAG